ncbi:MAG: tRNA (adenosine(37)-N6)-threonylcarbamoyltransferase complex transferase subunit TsaD [bacterium]|nr:tRNA (adenosine(37)-N6)-threonylcarbamoyltransferase complex transferase subunit TsaD [bacterium]
MIILGIETSCDETALSLIKSEGGSDIEVLADKTLSQIELHRQYGGVFPNMAKREHSRNLIPLLKTVLTVSGFGNTKSQAPNSKQIPNDNVQSLKQLLEREPEMLEQFLAYIPTLEKPPIDAIAVTEGPGLEPCLWTGINLAKALSLVWDIPIVPVNHMEGHIFSSLLRRKEISNDQFPRLRQSFGGQAISKQIPNPKSELNAIRYTLNALSFPALSLLISGGHTELVLIKSELQYEIIGQTRDDAVGEAFDKVARLLGLPYPGGPEISRLAEQVRSSLELRTSSFELPRPMLHSGDYDFSFSGIKTSVLYLLKKLPAVTDEIKREIALEFENAVTEVLVAKTRKALEHYGIQTLLLGGGVVANTHIRREFEKLSSEQGVPLHIPEKSLTTDNALMIAVVGLIRQAKSKTTGAGELRARGNLRLD